MPEHDIALRACYDQICFFVLSDLEQPLWTNGKHRFAIPEQYRVPEVLKTADWELEKSLKALGQFLKGKTYIVGDTFTMADILVAHTLNWADTFKFEVPDDFLAYRDAMYARPACKNALLKIETK